MRAKRRGVTRAMGRAHGTLKSKGLSSRVVTARCYVGERLELRGKTEKRSICEAMRCLWHGLVV